MRTRVPGEIVPLSAEQSSTRYGNEEKHGAQLAIDLDLETKSNTAKVSNISRTASWSLSIPSRQSSGEPRNGSMWLKIRLDGVHCVRKVFTISRTGEEKVAWNCNKDGCSCDELSCNDDLTLTVNTEGGNSGTFPLKTDCKHGDTVKLQKVYTGKPLGVTELAIIGKLLNYLSSMTFKPFSFPKWKNSKHLRMKN